MTPDELLKRLEAATGGDRELDAAIIEAFGFHSWAGRMSYPGDGGTWFDFGSSEVTASIDAALALVERVLPDWTAWEVRSRFGKKRFVCEISRLRDDSTEELLSGTADTPSLAILIALLRAIRTKDLNDGK